MRFRRSGRHGGLWPEVHSIRRALNGAAQWSHLSDVGCKALHRPVAQRVDALGPGYEFCLYTSERRHSRIFLTTDIAPDSEAVSIYFVTR